MTPKFAFSTYRDAAQRLRVAARDQGIGLHPLPYRRFDPDADDTWWLAPSTDNPAYGDGKIVIERPSSPSADAPIIGIHLEKGVGPAAAEFFSKSARGRRLLMHSNWTWNAFLRDMRGGRVEQDLLAAEQSADGWPLLVAVVTAVQDLPILEQDEERRRDEHPEVVWFQSSSGKLERSGVRDPGPLAHDLAPRETIASIGGKVAAMNDLDWRWVEVLIGIPFERVADGGESAAEVWARACAPWRRWLQDAPPT
jgi:hypothetical protein